jgi:hypothetical protein
MSPKPLRCRFGLHSYVQRHPDGERPPTNPDDKICRLCGKRTGTPFGNVPGGVIG